MLIIKVRLWGRRVCGSDGECHIHVIVLFFVWSNCRPWLNTELWLCLPFQLLMVSAICDLHTWKTLSKLLFDSVTQLLEQTCSIIVNDVILEVKTEQIIKKEMGGVVYLIYTRYAWDLLCVKPYTLLVQHPSCTPKHTTLTRTVWLVRWVYVTHFLTGGIEEHCCDLKIYATSPPFFFKKKKKIK